MQFKHLAIASDHAGYELKGKVLAHLAAQNVPCLDLGCHGTESVDYPNYAFELGRAIASGKADGGIAICGSGLGMVIGANKVPGIRAASAWSKESAELGRAHNNANVIGLGARLLDEDLALSLIDIWLSTPFAGGERHERRVRMLDQAPVIRQ